MSQSTKEKLLIAAVSAILGVLATGTASMLLVGNSIHSLETKMDSNLSRLSERVASLEVTVKYLDTH